jgi:hypothetical protein
LVFLFFFSENVVAIANPFFCQDPPPSKAEQECYDVWHTFEEELKETVRH